LIGVIEMNLKNIISIFVLMMIVLMVLPSAYGYTFGGRGALHDIETSDYVLHPGKDKVMTLLDLQNSVVSNNVLSDGDYMLYPEGKPINMHDFAGYGSMYGTPQSGLQEIGPHLNGIGPHLDSIGPDLTHDQFGAWGEPCSIGAWGQFYGLGVI
jgi:hypothetical protein